MRKYEIVFIVKPNLEEGAIKEVAENFKKVLVDNGANVVNFRDFGQKEFAYEIGKFNSGHYFIANIEANDDKAVNEFRRLCLINENILRHLITRED